MTPSAADVIDAVRPIMGRPIELPINERDDDPINDQPHAGERDRIFNLLGPLRTVLLELELAGRLERHGGGMVSLI